MKFIKPNYKLLNKKIKFGRYKGEKWRNLPDDYLWFLVSEKCHTFEHRKNLARAIIEEKEKEEFKDQGVMF